MFLFKKIIASLLMPLSVIAALLLLGLLLLLASRLRRTGTALITLGVALLLVLSSSPLSEQIAAPLEYRYQALGETQSLQGVRWIVVLGSGHTTTATLSPNSELNGSALARLNEGLRLQRALPQATLLLSGGAVFDSRSNAAVMAQTAVALGFDRDAIVVEERPRDTAEEAELISAWVDNEPFILVTSALHMPRAIALFERQGSRPIPAPTDYTIKYQVGGGDKRPLRWLPNPSRLQTLQRAWHEHLGMTWSRWRGEL